MENFSQWNSGIIFLVKEDPKYEASFHTGMEMQVLDNNAIRMEK